MKSLSIEKMEECIEISNWINQFPDDKQLTALQLLIQLRFVSRDSYSKWLNNTINTLVNDDYYAMYSVRKLDESRPFWDSIGNIQERPGDSQGSEDLVYSLISNATRRDEYALDHPSISILRENKIRNIILIDDSIGSGDRVSGFINSMLGNKTFLSWWSLGLMKIHVLSYARPRGASDRIISGVIGSDHGKRKFRKSEKIKFNSKIVFSKADVAHRWGSNCGSILDLCDSIRAVQKWARKGYGEVMGNIVFEHSVPNNIPGLLWFSNKKWNALFPNRSLPVWFIKLIQGKYQAESSSNSGVSDQMFSFLNLIKKGVRNPTSLACRLNCEQSLILEYMSMGVSSGFLSEKIRLTKVGYDLLFKMNKQKKVEKSVRKMYIPTSWCADLTYIQPQDPKHKKASFLPEAVEDFADSNWDDIFN